MGFWWCSRALLEEEEEGGRGGEGGGGEGEENKEKEKEEEGQEAPYNWLPPDHPPLAAFTGNYNILAGGGAAPLPTLPTTPPHVP